MAIQTDSKANIVSKLALGKAHTSNGREHYNESEVSSFLLASQNIFANVINSTPGHDDNIGVVAQVTLELDEFPNSSGDPQSYLCKLGGSVPESLSGRINPKTGAIFVPNDRVGFIVDRRFGGDFDVVLTDVQTASIIYPLDASDWVVDSFSGIITQETDDPSSMFDLGTQGTLDCYVYVGAFVSDVLSTSGSSLDIINDITQLQTDVANISAQLGGGDGSQFAIDEFDTTTGYFTDKILPGSNVTFSEQISGGEKSILINAEIEANAIFGSQEIPLNDDTTRITYGQTLSGSGTPIVSLVLPTSASFMQITGIYNSNTTGFDVMLSAPVRQTGYKINWTLNTSQQFDLSSIGQSLIPSGHEIYDLGTPENSWRDLHLSGQTMYIGSQTISVVEPISGEESQISFSGNELVVLDDDGALPLSALPEEISSGLSFIDVLDPTTTNLPNISGSGIGSYYIAGATGTFTDTISASFSVSEGDWALNNGTTWKKMPFKLPVRGITSAQIKIGAIQSDNIFSGAVTEDKIANDSVTISKIESNVFNIDNFNTTENDINKVLRPDGSGGFVFGNSNLDVDALDARITVNENALATLDATCASDSDLVAVSGGLDSRITTLENESVDFSPYTTLTTTASISSNLQTQIDTKLDTSTFAALSGSGGGGLQESDLSTLTLPIATTANISGNAFYGDGSNLAGVTTDLSNYYTKAETDAEVAGISGGSGSSQTCVVKTRAEMLAIGTPVADTSYAIITDATALVITLPLAGDAITTNEFKTLGTGIGDVTVTCISGNTLYYEALDVGPDGSSTPINLSEFIGTSTTIRSDGISNWVVF